MLLWRTCRVGLVWLTGLMTLLSGAPHLTCVCPNGRAHSFYFGLALNGACSCGKAGGCCGANGCCAAGRARPDGAPCSLHRPNCHRTVSASAVVAVPSPTKPDRLSTPLTLFVVPSPDADPSACPRPRGLPTFSNRATASLSLSLRRLLI